MKRQSAPYISLLLIISLLFSPILKTKEVLAADAIRSKLYYTKMILPATIGISSDVSIGQVPTGITINKDNSNLVVPASSKFSFTSDDGAQNDWNYRDVFDARGVSCVIPLVEDYVTGRLLSNPIDLSTFITLQNDYGYEIGSHSYDHVKLTDYTNPTVVVTGDVNGDGKITLTDYVQMKSRLLGKTSFASPNEMAGDVNGDGKITLTDYVKMKAHLLGKEFVIPQAY